MNEEDRSRVEDFRQFRRKVRGSREFLLVGIDVAKDKHYAFLARPPERRFSSDWFLKITWRDFEGFWPRRRQ